MKARHVTNIENEILVQALERVQATDPLEPFVLVGVREEGSYLVLSPTSIAQWLYTTLSEVGSVEKLKWGVDAARSFVRDGDLIKWGLAFYRATNHWTVYSESDSDDPRGGREAIDGTLHLRRTELRWRSKTSELEEIERSLPEMRRAAAITLRERENGVTWEQANARDTLAEALRRCRDLSAQLGKHQKARAYGEELGPLLVEGLKVKTDGLTVAAVDGQRNHRRFPFSLRRPRSSKRNTSST